MNSTRLTRSFRTMTPLFAAAFLLTACDDDPATPPEDNEQELITQVTVTLTPVGGGAALTSSITDPDGLGAQPPQAATATLALAAGVTYNGTVEFLDASDPNDVEDITEEVEEEADEHRIFYIVTGVTGVTVPDASLDQDGNGAPVGLTYQVVADAAAAGTGTLRVVLSHYDDEPKGDGSEQSDETDADVSFPMTVN